MSKLSDRVRPNSEAAPWVIEEIKRLEAALAKLAEGLDEITGLSRYLRQGGCDSTDLRGLEEGLIHAIDLAAEMLSMIENEEEASTK